MINESSMNVFPDTFTVDGQIGVCDIATNLTTNWSGSFTIPQNLKFTKAFVSFVGKLDNADSVATKKFNVVIKDGTTVVGTRDITGADLIGGKVADVPFACSDGKNTSYSITITNSSSIKKGSLYGVVKFGFDGV